MQQELDALYLNYLQTIFSDKILSEMIENFVVSSPQFLDVETPRGNYLKSDCKVLFIGKETSGWFNKEEREKEDLTVINGQYIKYIEALKRNYCHLDLGKNYRSSIYIFIDILRKKLSQDRTVGILLTEVLRHDYHCVALPEEIKQKVTFDNNIILRKEIEILKPDVLVFLTGPNYDRFISHTYPMAQFKQIENRNLREVSIIENIPQIQKAIRIYHPGYHNRIDADYKYEIADLVSKFLN